MNSFYFVNFYYCTRYIYFYYDSCFGAGAGGGKARGPVILRFRDARDAMLLIL